MAAAGPDHHVSVLLQDDIGAVVEVEDGDGIELGWGTAGLGHCVRVDEVDLGDGEWRRVRWGEALLPGLFFEGTPTTWVGRP